MTLREEIHSYFEKWTYSHPDYVTEQMLKLFENLIDEKVASIKNIAYSLDALTVSDWIIKELDNLKEEIEKE